MLKITLHLLLFPLFSFAYFSSDCPSRKEVWVNYQRAIKGEPSLNTIENLRQVCLRCHYQDSTYAQILVSVAQFYYSQKEYKAAIGFINEAIKINKSHRKDVKESYLANNYFNLARNYSELGDTQKALEMCDLSILEVKKNINNQKYLLNTYALKANILVKMGDFEKAIAQSNVGISYTGISLNNDGLVGCYIEKAKAQILTKNLEEGKVSLDLAMKIIDKKSLNLMGYAYYWYAQYYQLTQNSVQAIDFYHKSQTCYTPFKDRNYAAAFIDIGMIYYNQNDFDKALDNFEKALRTMDSPYAKVRILDNIAASYWQKKDYEKAFVNYQKSLSIAPIGFKSESLFDNPSLKALKIADLKTFYLTTLQDKADTWLEYYQKTKQKEHLKVALDTYFTADKLVDIMRFGQTGIKSKLYWRNQTHSLYEKAIETCYLLKDYEKAFYFFEKSKAVLLNDKLNELSANQQLSTNDLAQEKDFQQQVSELNKKISGEKESSQLHLDLQNKLVEIQTQQEQFIKGLETKNPAYFRYKYDTTLSNLGDVKKYLIKAKSNMTSGSTLIEYFVGDNAIYALKVTAEKTDLLKISLGNYGLNAKQFLKYCTDNQLINKNYQDFLKVSNQLYQQLFKNLNPSAGRLIIAQDGYFLPFEALSKSAKKADYLLNDYAISYTYSVQFLLKNLGEKSFSMGDKFMGMSPVDFSKNLNQTPLSGSDISLKNVCDNFYFGKTFYKKEATKKAFFDNARKYQIVHLYTHAQADSSDQEPMIYFADSVLKLSEISDLQRFKTQLLVLSACKTAVGRNAKGEGILSLSRGFATQGIPATLTTLWSVENQATYTLNELFYRYITQGETKDVALQKAKIEFLKSQSGEKQLPTFWAAAVLVGDAEAISSGFQWWWLLGVIALALILIKILRIKKNKQ